MNLLDLARSALPRHATASAPGAARRWQVHFPRLDPVEVLFTPEATQDEVAALYPGARIEPLPELAGAATPDEAAELRKLVALVATEWPEHQRAEALAAALADPEAALMSFRLLAAESRVPEAGS